MTKQIAIIGSDVLFLEYLLEAIAESALADNTVRLYSAVLSRSDTLTCNGQPLAFSTIEQLANDKPDLVILLEKPTVIEAYQESLLELDCPVLGFWQDIKKLNPQRLETISTVLQGSVFGVCKPQTDVLQKLFADFQLEDLDITLMAGASIYGQEGVNALAGQAARLLNARSLEPDVLGRQLAFNAYPAAETAAGQIFEQALRADLAERFPSVNISFASAQLPVFYGILMRLSAVFVDQPDLEAVLEVFAGKPGVSIDPGQGAFSILDAVSFEGEVLLSGIRQNQADNHRLDLWISFDDLKYSAKFQMISAADFLLKHHL